MVIKVLLQKMVPYIFSNLWWSLHVLIMSGDETNHKDGLFNFSHLGQDINVKCGQSNFKVCKSYFDSFKKALEVRGYVAGRHEVVDFLNCNKGAHIQRTYTYNICNRRMFCEIGKST